MNGEIPIGEAFFLAGPLSSLQITVELDNGRKYRLSAPAGHRVTIDIPPSTLAQEIRKFHAPGCPINKLDSFCNCNRQDNVAGMARQFTPYAN